MFCFSFSQREPCDFVVVLTAAPLSRTSRASLFATGRPLLLSSRKWSLGERLRRRGVPVGLSACRSFCPLPSFRLLATIHATANPAKMFTAWAEQFKLEARRCGAVVAWTTCAFPVSHWASGHCLFFPEPKERRRALPLDNLLLVGGSDSFLDVLCSYHDALASRPPRETDLDVQPGAKLARYVEPRTVGRLLSKPAEIVGYLGELTLVVWEEIERTNYQLVC